MKTEVKKIDSTKRQVAVTVAGEVVKNKFDDVFKKVGQEAKVPGFRPGHVPRDILEKQYSSFVHEQVVKELVPELYSQAIAKEGLEVIELPEISEVKLDRAQVSFIATVSVSPEIKLKEYKGIKVEYKDIAVGEDEVARTLDSLKESRKMDALDDTFVKGLGYPDLASLKKALEMQLYLQKENAQRQGLENAIVDKLLKDVDFKVPQSLVKRQLDDLVRQAKLDLALKGVPREKIEEEEKNIIPQFESDAKKQVQVYLILSEIAKKENIPIDDHMPRKIMEFLLREADWNVG
ncbi:MAG: hypothetical protein KKC84_04545 [Candidatus Omnitrophica bacterium]|nr:hypothetical protein [Candidatus Omnitrophota bacterium]